MQILWRYSQIHSFYLTLMTTSWMGIILDRTEYPWSHWVSHRLLPNTKSCHLCTHGQTLNGITCTGIDYSGKHRIDNTAFPHFAFSLPQEGLINSFHTEVGQPCPGDLHFKGGKWFEREIFAVVDCQSQNRGWETAGGWGGEVLRIWEAALCFEPALRALCSWLSPSSGRPPSLCPFLSGSFAFLLSFQDSELLGNSRQELRFSLWWAVSGQGQGVWWSLGLQVSVQKGRQHRQPPLIPFSPPRDRESEKSGWGTKALFRTFAISPSYSPAPFSHQQDFLPRWLQNVPGALGFLLPHSDPQWSGSPRPFTTCLLLPSAVPPSGASHLCGQTLWTHSFS